MRIFDALATMGVLAGVGVAIDAAEVLVTRRALAPAGLYSWDVLGVGRSYLVKGWAAPGLHRLFRYPAVLLLPTVQLAAAAALLVQPFLPPGPQRAALAAAGLTAAVARALFYMRQQLGLDGADQMLLLVLVSVGVGAVLGDTPAGAAAIDYAALQLLLSYAIAGTAKAISSHWRSGRAIVGITATVGLGQPWAHALLARRPGLARWVCWAVIGFECVALPLALTGTRGAWAVIVAGLCFHVGVAVVMGLNVFVWAFAAAYPALLFLARQVEHVASRR